MGNRATSWSSGIEAEESLIDGVRLRDQEALARIYDRFASTVYSVALRILREEAAAEQVMREVFLHVWRNPEEYSIQRGPLWMRLALDGRNRAMDALRGCDTSERNIDHMALDSCAGFNDLDGRNCAVQKMRKTISSLPSIQRQMLDCVVFNGLTLAEIAASTGEPLHSVKAHIRCALALLRNAIHEGDGDWPGLGDL